MSDKLRPEQVDAYSGYEIHHIKTDPRLKPTAWIMHPTPTGFILKFSWWAWLMIKLGIRRPK